MLNSSKTSYSRAPSKVTITQITFKTRSCHKSFSLKPSDVSPTANCQLSYVILIFLLGFVLILCAYLFSRYFHVCFCAELCSLATGFKVADVALVIYVQIRNFPKRNCISTNELATFTNAPTQFTHSWLANTLNLR